MKMSTTDRLLGLRVGIPPGAWMVVRCECCVLSGRGLCDGLITRPEESCRLWCVLVCDLETSRMRRFKLIKGCKCRMEEERHENKHRVWQNLNKGNWTGKVCNTVNCRHLDLTMRIGPGTAVRLLSCFVPKAIFISPSLFLPFPCLHSPSKFLPYLISYSLRCQLFSVLFLQYLYFRPCFLPSTFLSHFTAPSLF
jgi:hypothetical protein